jgi:outer membrane protein TolC
MTRPALDRVALSSRRTRIVQIMGIYDSKTDQTAQSDQRIGNAEQLGGPLDRKPTSPHPKLTSGTAQRSNPDVQVAGARLESARARRSDAGLQP